jgi:hypothetical protein
MQEAQYIFNKAMSAITFVQRDILVQGFDFSQ